MMVRFTAERSPLRQFLLGVAGIILILAALDVVWVHRVSMPPDTNEQGQLTTRGQARQRQDFLWGSGFLVVGGTLLLVALGGLLTHDPVVEITDDALRLRIAGARRFVTIPWADVQAVRSGREEGEGRHPRPVLWISVTEPERYPTHLWGAEWVGRWIRVDADGWNQPPGEVAVHAQVELDRVLREATEDETAAPGDEPVDA